MFLNDRDLQVREYPVNKDYGDSETFFRLTTPFGEVQLPKLQFQLDQPLPDTLVCRVKETNGRAPQISHHMPRYVSEFYADGFSKGQEFEFKVIGLQEGPKGFYRLTDSNGIIFKLHESKANLAKGQTVKCKFEAMGPNYFSLRRSVTDTLFPMLKLSDVTRISSIHGLNASKLEGYLQQIPELDEALDELNHGRPVWIMTAIRAIKQIMPRIFQTSVDQLAPETVFDIIKGYERLLLNLLQGSGFLRNIKGTDRTSLQAELTAQLEQIDTYKRTLRIVTSGEQHKFIDNLLDNLKESGYLYHPTTQFSIMMMLFKMSPELVNSSLGNIFDTLMGWDPETWKTEPFRQAFVEQLEIYISETRQDIDQFLQPETPDDNEKIEKMLTAIAIQQSLATDSDDTVDRELNKSLFYRYLSLLRSTKAEVLLHKSYLALMGVPLPTDYTWSDIKEPTMMMTRAAVDPPSTAVLPEDSKFYITKDIEIEVGQFGISIGRNGEYLNNALPNGMLPWPGLEVRSDRTINRQKLKTMEGHAEFWKGLEEDLFMPAIVTTEQQSTRRMADIGDTVRIKIERVIPAGNDSNKVAAFTCSIVDDHFLEDSGILPAENIVNYNLHGVTLGTFRDDHGEHMLFDAQVVDIDDNDRLIFSIADQARQAIRDMANVGEECYCVVTKDNGRSYSAISEKGFGLYVNKEHDGTPPFHRGNVLKVELTGYTNDAIQSRVVEGPVDNHPFYNALALHNLLRTIAVRDGNSEDTEMEPDDDDLISREVLCEIIDILRYKAISCRNNILMAFDYLCFARLMAMAVGDDNMAATLKAHKDILLLHQHYAKNKKLFNEDIDKILDEAPESVLIHRMANRLRIVASLEQSEDNGKIWDIINNTTNDTEKELGQMVLSFNLLHDLNKEDPTAASIKDKIAQMLNVDSEQRKLKYYGSESQYVEFKSSLVYPARKGRAGLSAADPDKQEFEILHIIAGFLNSYGGTLYIGVNDDHYERGLEEDFSFYRMDTSERNTRFRRSIKSLDNMANYLQNLIDNSFSLGKNAGNYATTSIDEESVKGVVVVKIEPCPHIVYLDNTIYVRHGAKTEPLIRKDDISMFISDRPHIFKQMLSPADTQEEPAAEETAQVTAEEEVQPVEQQPAEEQQHTEEAFEATNNFSIATSRIRKNVLHEYDDPDHYVQPQCYIRFVDDDKFIITKDEWSIDTDNDRLVLTVTDDEVDDYLVLVYEDEYALKVRIRELIEKISNSPISHYADRKLVFACPVSANGGLYAMYANSKNTMYERVTPVDRIAQGSMSTAPERLLEVDSYTTVMHDIATPEKMSEMSPILSTGMKRTQIGSLVKGVSSVKTSKEDAERAALNRLR